MKWSGLNFMRCTQTTGWFAFYFLLSAFLFACDQSGKTAAPSNNHQGHTDQASPTQHEHQTPQNPVELSGDWLGWVYASSSEDHLLIIIEKATSPSSKVALPPGKTADDTELWSIKINFSQKAMVLSGSCNIRESNSKNQEPGIEGTITGKIDPTKKALLLRTDDNMDDPFGGRSITLHWQDKTINKLSGSFDDEKEEPAEPTPSPETPQPTPPSEPPPHHH